jgi:hypothetical protein
MSGAAVTRGAHGDDVVSHIAPDDRRHAQRRAVGRGAGLVATLVLAIVYAATAARDVTFWDAGELATAIGTWGIPHPPGTPLYVAIGRALMLLLPGASPVQAGIALSVLASAAAGGVAAATMAAALVHRDGDARDATIVGAAAGVAAGAMGSVWLNATEAEVYGVALACSAAQLALAWRAHARDDDRARAAVLTVAALSLPLHLSAIVSAPAALLLACTAPDGTIRWRSWIGSGALLFAVVLASTGRLAFAAACLVVVALAGRAAGHETRWLARGAFGVALASSAVLVLWLRARHAPWLAQGDPSTWSRFVAVVAREQYAVAGPWPRRAPLWLQVGNLFQYADWQLLLSVWSDVVPHVVRTPATVALAGLGALGARTHWRAHRPSARAWALLVLLGSLGVVALLNLRAGPSFGHGVLAEGAAREARERDYFFALAFWGWGAWAALGAATIARRRGAVALAVLLVAGNWHAISRRDPNADALPRAVAAALLADAPPEALLLTAGDNDTYPTWYLQGVERVRPDVRTVVWPLLGAPWYVTESWQVLGTRPIPRGAFAGGAVERAAALVAGWRAAGRPVAVSIAVPSTDRAALAAGAGIACWVRRGTVDVAAAPSAPGTCPPRVDVAATTASARRLARWETVPAPRVSPDGMATAWRALLRCPGAGELFLERACNLR